MAKTFFWSPLAAGLLYAATLYAQPAVVKAPEVVKARACLDKLAAEGKKAGLFTDRDGPQILILNPTRAELLPLLVTMGECMDDAFGEQEIVKHPRTGTSSRVWFVSAEGQYAWCASNSLDNTLEQIDVLGGSGPRRDWYGVTLSCNIGEKILGFYTP